MKYEYFFADLCNCKLARDCNSICYAWQTYRGHSTKELIYYNVIYYIINYVAMCRLQM